MNLKITLSVVTFVSLLLLVSGCLSSFSDNGNSSTSTPTSTLEPVTNTTSIETNYQDTQWLKTVIADGTPVENDLKNVGSAAQKSDLTTLSTYSNSLLIDSQNAIDNCDLYEVSPELKSAKKEYKSAMVDANKAAYYINLGLEENDKGDAQSATSYFDEATKLMTSIANHSNNYVSLIDAYKSKQ